MSTGTVTGLCVFLLILVIVLVFMYKKLNRETEGQYTIRRIVYKEGGLRDRVRDAAVNVGARLGVQLWPGTGEDQEAGMQGEGRLEEVELDSGDSQPGSNSEGEDEEEERESANHSRSTKGKESDKSSLGSSNSYEQERLINESEVLVVVDVEGNGEAKEEKEQGQAEPGAGTGLLIDLKQFSGSAIWSEEDGAEGRSSDVTAL